MLIESLNLNVINFCWRRPVQENLVALLPNVHLKNHIKLNNCKCTGVPKLFDANFSRI